MSIQDTTAAINDQVASVEHLARAWSSVRDIIKETISLSLQLEDSQLLVSKTLKENLMDMTGLTKAVADQSAAMVIFAADVKAATAEIATLMQQLNGSPSQADIDAITAAVAKNTATINASAAQLEAAAANHTTTTGTGGDNSGQSL